uniref:Uncharacterized protein n=1 Tax=Magnetospirillum gryphiswaldense TaxID=55518 RepID=A4U4D0_9PROT|nr:hypothetical protein MGR_3805 [Magnetospirillum gryphiswaldense MSR-1]
MTLNAPSAGNSRAETLFPPYSVGSHSFVFFPGTGFDPSLGPKSRVETDMRTRSGNG